MRILINVLCVLIWVLPGKSQSYLTAAGFRVGKDVSISISQRIEKRTTIDLYHETGLVTSRSFTGLAYKKHVPILTKRLNFFGGAGPFYQFTPVTQTVDFPFEYKQNYGLLLTGGIDFTVGRINIGYDIMPAFILAGDSGPTRRFTSSSAITVRYVLVKQPSLLKRLFKKKK